MFATIAVERFMHGCECFAARRHSLQRRLHVEYARGLASKTMIVSVALEPRIVK